MNPVLEGTAFVLVFLVAQFVVAALLLVPAIYGWSGFRWRARHALQSVWLAIRMMLGGHRGAWGVLKGAWQPPSKALAWRLKRFGPTILSDVQDAVRRSGAPVFLVFGSLLGQVRDGGLIDGDTDIDLAIMAGASHGLVAFRDIMRAKGYHDRGDRVLPRLVAASRGGVHVDLYTFWKNGRGEVFSMSGDGKGGTLQFRFPEGDVVPLKRLEGWLVPARPEAFLSRHYGDWQTPNLAWDYRVDAGSTQGAGS